MFRWLGGAAALAVVLSVPGCGADGRGTVVVGVPETTAPVEAPTVSALVSPTVVVAVPPTAPPALPTTLLDPLVLSSTTAASPQPTIVVSPVPVVEGGGASGLVGDVPVGPVPPGGVLAGPGDSLGPLVFRRLSPWEHKAAEVVGEAFDVCDEQQAFAAANFRYLEPGEEPGGEELLQAAMLRETPCSPGESRYVCVSAFGWTERVASRQDALRLCKEAEQEAVRQGVELLGHLAHPGNESAPVFPSVAADAVVVVAETVSVIDGVVRGLIHNQSRTQFARYVTVKAVDEAGGGVWSWPLTMQPGERVPFEIAGWTAGINASGSSLVVSGFLSPYIDITRSFAIDGPVTRDGKIFLPKIEFVEPTSHPSLVDTIMGQAVGSIRAFGAFFDNGSVIDVVELTPANVIFPPNYPDETEPVEEPITSVTAPHGWFKLWVALPTLDLRIWVGGANPPPVAPPVLQPTGPPLRVPRTPSPGE